MKSSKRIYIVSVYIFIILQFQVLPKKNLVGKLSAISRKIAPKFCKIYKSIKKIYTRFIRFSKWKKLNLTVKGLAVGKDVGF